MSLSESTHSFNCPYPGLRPYLEDDAERFFGRSLQIVQMLKRLETHRFLAVVGASGCGKSSLVQAGLLPALKDGFLMGAPPNWRMVKLQPGDSPLRNLARELHSTLRSEKASDNESVDATSLYFGEATLRSSHRGLLGAIADHQLPGETNVLVLVDQFEEIFRYQEKDDSSSTCEEESQSKYQRQNEAIEFVNLLLTAVAEANRPVYVIITMRSDFLGDCDQFQDLPEAISQSQFLTPRMTRDQLREAIVGPLELFHAEAEPGLVDRILNDVGTESDQLPLMQHALRRTWKHSSAKTAKANLRIADYEHVGGVSGALDQHANEIFNALGDATTRARLQRVAERLFCSLSERSGSGPPTRRPIIVAQAALEAGATEAEIETVARAFQASNLLVFSPPGQPFGPKTRLDISHEALIRRWKRFGGQSNQLDGHETAKSWLEMEEQHRRCYRRLAELAEDEKKLGLLKNPELALLNQWWETYDPTPAWADTCVNDSYDRTDEYLKRSLKQSASPFRTRASLGEQDELLQPSLSQGADTIQGPAYLPKVISATSLAVDRPTLVLQTVYFQDSEHPEAFRLGQDLYEQLTRPINDPLAFGAGIPVLSAVAADRVDLDAAEIVVVIPVLGGISFASKRQTVLTQLTDWHTRLGDGQLLIVPTAVVWRSVEDRLVVKHLLTELYGKDDKDDKRRKTLDEIVLAVTRLLEPERKNVRLFVSHAKAELAASDDVAKLVHDHIVTETTGHAFFDTVSLHAGSSLADQLDNAVGDGVFLAVKGDGYSSRAWCQRELLTAKRHKLPWLSVDVLKSGEQRTSPYGGNGPSIVWNWNPATVVARAMIEWLRSAYFRKEGERLKRVAGLPNDTIVLARPPELLDLVQGSLVSAHAKLALYPDPELPGVELQILNAARPRLQLVTPTTAFRRLLSREENLSTVTSPLDGLQVAISLSDSPDVNGSEGFTAEHVRDATVYVARSLISAGAAIAYGGDLRKNAFTQLLAELILLAEMIGGYNQTAVKSADLLHSYLGAPLKLENVPDGLPLTVHHLVEETEAKPDVRQDAILPPPSDKERHPDALYYSDMRQVMAKHTFARIVLGGTAEPRTDTNPKGYGGRLPGVVEEAWRTLEVGKPLYVLGGFGGAAGLVADLLEGRLIPERMYDKTWQDDASFQQTAKAIDEDPYSTKLGLPNRLEDLAEAVMQLAKPLLATDAASLKWNGLTVDENRRVLRTRDPVIIASLVLKGLLNVARADVMGKMQIELVQGSVTTGSNLDAVAVAAFDEIPLGGAGAALDQAIGGRISTERAEGRTLISLESPEIDANWLYLASVGPLANVDGLEQRVEQAARETAHQAQRVGFQRLGVVTFGGSVLPDIEALADAMLRGFAELRGHVTIVWFETNADRFDRLHKKLAGQKDDVHLTTRRTIAIPTAPSGRKEELILQVSLVNDELSVTTLLPEGSAFVSQRRIKLTAEDVSALTIGSGVRKRATPDQKTLNRRGAELAETLFGKDATQLLKRCSHARTMIIHDVSASKLPFEILTNSDASIRPAVLSGISRRLAVEGVPIERLFAKPPKTGLLNVLMIVNPTEDLPGTEKEANAVKKILELQKSGVKLTMLTRREATRNAVKAALAQADVLHYCGHAFFHGPGRDECGLILAGRELLTLAVLEKIPSLPRVAFLNACAAGRVRGSTTTDAAAFAELFLRSGFEVYLGTQWEVGDSAAASFATGVYTRLADGQTLESAVTKSRAELLKDNERDWANYVLYGDGRFKLVVG